MTLLQKATKQVPHISGGSPSLVVFSVESYYSSARTKLPLKKSGSLGIAVVRALDKGPHLGVEGVLLTPPTPKCDYSHGKTFRTINFVSLRGSGSGRSNPILRSGRLLHSVNGVYTECNECVRNDIPWFHPV